MKLFSRQGFWTCLTIFVFNLLMWDIMIRRLCPYERGIKWNEGDVELSHRLQKMVCLGEYEQAGDLTYVISIISMQLGSSKT